MGGGDIVLKTDYRVLFNKFHERISKEKKVNKYFTFTTELMLIFLFYLF